MASRQSEETAEQVAARRERNERLYEDTIMPRGQETLQKYCKDVLQKVELKLEEMQRCPAEGRTRSRRDAYDRLFREQFTFRVTNGRRDKTAFAG